MGALSWTHVGLRFWLFSTGLCSGRLAEIWLGPFFIAGSKFALGALGVRR